MKRITPTLAICLAGALATAVGLARPPQETAAPLSPPARPVIPGAPARSEPIEIAGFSYSDVAVAPGSVVEVRNIDGVVHTVTADDFDTGPIDGSSAATFVAPDTPGIYEFFCAVHPSMEGTLVVEPVPSGGGEPAVGG